MKKGVKKIIGAVVLFVAGMLMPAAVIIPLIMSGDGDKPFRVPGSMEITVEKPGRYYLWNQYRTIYEGRSYSFDKELPGGLSFSLTEKASGTAVPLETGMNISSESGNRRKASIGYFEVPRPGTYIISVTGNTEERILSFGKSIFESVLLFFGGMTLAILLAIAAAVGSLILLVFGILDLAREPAAAGSVSGPKS